MNEEEVLAKAKATEECGRLTTELESQAKPLKKLKEEVSEKEGHLATLEKKLAAKEAEMKQWLETTAESALVGGSDKYISVSISAYEGWEVKVHKLREEAAGTARLFNEALSDTLNQRKLVCIQATSIKSWEVFAQQPVSGRSVLEVEEAVGL